MNALSRIGVAIESDLLATFDELIARRGYPSRSEAFRDLIRDALAAESAQADAAPVVGCVTLVYDHHVRQLSAKLTALQHEHHGAIVSTLHVHLDEDNCLEVIVVRGKARDVQQLADGLISTKGVRHGRLTITSATAAPEASTPTPEAGAKDDGRTIEKPTARRGHPHAHAHGHRSRHTHSHRE